MIVEKQINTIGLVWAQQINQTKDYWIHDILITPSGRMFIAYEADGDNVRYSDDNGETLTKCTGTEYVEKLCITKTGRILAIINEASGYLGYSDDNGATWNITWSPYNTGIEDNIADLYSLSTGRLLMSVVARGIWYSDNNGETWTQSNRTNGTYKLLGASPTGRLFIGHVTGTAANNNGILYSDNNGETWTQSKKTNGTGTSLCITPTGRIIVGSTNGIWYSDDNGVNWTQSNKTNGSWRGLYCTSSGRLLAGSTSNNGIWYSDDNGVNWEPSNKTDGSLFSLCVTSTGIIIACGGNSSNKGIWYSDGITETRNDYSSKPLTGAQARQLVAECKAYVQELKQS